MANPQHVLVIDLETRPDVAILPVARDPAMLPKPIQNEIITLGFLLARIEREGESRATGRIATSGRVSRSITSTCWGLAMRSPCGGSGTV
jgi:hypothetical protein